MASTITPSDLIVTISESYLLNGVQYGNSMNKTFTSNGQVSQRVMSIPGLSDRAVYTNILALSTVDGQGQVVKADYKYFRVTNLDNTNSLYLRIFNGTDYLAFNIPAASSFLLMDASVDSPANATAILVLADITAIAGQSSSTSEDIDIEFVIVTT